MPKNGTVETVRNRRDRSWGLKIAKNWLETIRKISGTIWKISGTIWKTSGTVWRISRAILECTNCLANINLQIRMPSEHLQTTPHFDLNITFQHMGYASSVVGGEQKQPHADSES